MKNNIKVDVAIIGAGTAGISAFKEASKYTQNILLMDHGPLGTTCARIGCMPSKLFIQAAKYFHERKYFAERGISGADDIKVNIPVMMKYVRKMRDDFVSSTVEYIKSLGDKFINEIAEMDEPNVIRVGDRKIIAKNIIIATGSSSLIPDAWFTFLDQILTCDNFFEQNNFDHNIVVIGGGLIGLELGQALHYLGKNMNLFHSHEMIGKLTDPEVNNHAVKILQQEYSLHINQKAEIKKEIDFLLVKGKDKNIKTQQVLAALGRKPNLMNINFEKLGIKINETGMPLFDPTTMQIKNTSIFIAGDATKERQLLHEAADEGYIAAYNAIHGSQSFRRRTPMTIIFSDPNIAIVGQSYHDLQKQECITGEVDFSHQGRSRIMSKNKGILRIYAEPKNGTLLGAEMIAPEGEHLAHLLAWAIQQNLTVFDVLQMPFYHPVVEEGVRTALRELSKKIKSKHTVTMCDSEVIPNLS